jgi:tetratricopeptide (TPR) repeat protein
MLGDFTLALQQAEGLVQSNPNDINAYETLVNVLEAGLEYCQEEGNNEQTALLAHELVEVQSKLEEQKSKIDQDKPWNGPPRTLSAEVQYSIAKANYLLGNYEESLAIFRIASPDLFNEEVNENTPQPVLEQLAWYAASLYKTGNTVEADNITRQLKTLNAQVYSTYERLIDQEPLP